jgi:hypothetical protein
MAQKFPATVIYANALRSFLRVAMHGVVDPPAISNTHFTFQRQHNGNLIGNERLLLYVHVDTGQGMAAGEPLCNTF